MSTGNSVDNYYCSGFGPFSTSAPRARQRHVALIAATSNTCLVSELPVACCRERAQPLATMLQIESPPLVDTRSDGCHCFLLRR